ncbi:PREDICTED: ATP-dependent RNA helicase DHX36 [Ceratosolen solmsi marchali]|uniref:RNA helicase n=1 Tax=Ceratosolen solmsi marchali TaxID=326594 RepID=A0AAJ7E081_9HYME|nr:PREDICTED: ATP-dependent RNA helicase DHX36 [Ceratosolen solmsi marchali]
MTAECFNRFSRYKSPRHRGKNNRMHYKNIDQSAEGSSQANNSEMTMEFYNRPSRGRPPGLKGKSIGLYYRDKMIKNNRYKPKSRIKIRPSTLNMIQKLILHPKCTEKKSYNYKLQNSINEDYGKQYNHILDPKFKRKFLSLISGNLQHKIEQDLTTKPLLERRESVDINLLNELNDKRLTSEYKKLLDFRKKLPAYQNKQSILDLINANQIVLISGETGCGKTTQVAQLILDYEIECGRGSTTCIACTQPRRISAISVAERVAVERVENLGNSVGYHIRLEKILARPYGSIVFCTTGMLLQFMQIDAALRNYSHIILDEIHERSIHSDIIITLLKFILPKRSDLKLILMSATLNSDQFSKYYNDCPSMHISGFTFPVEEFYLEDILKITHFKFPKEGKVGTWQKYLKKNINKEMELINHKALIESYYTYSNFINLYSVDLWEELLNPKSEDISFDLILDLTKHICLTQKPGAVLIFLPGLIDITGLHKLFLESDNFPQDICVFYALHSKMPTAEQKEIFDIPPPGIRKIIISTVLAETSITIEDVVYVIDCGKQKLSKFDIKNNLQTLDIEWISKANALQRRGRAGRVQPGICYHLYTKARAETLDQYPLPEILRIRLEEIILQIKILQIGKVDTFLATMLDAPDPKTISVSLQLLRQLKALDDQENLTPLGYHLAHLPLDPRTGKIIILAAMFSCIDPIFSIVASLSFKDPFYCPLGKEIDAIKKKIELGLNQFSDHIAICEALKRFEEIGYKGMKRSLCQEYFLSWNTMKLLSDMKKQFASYLYEMNFLRNNNPKDHVANRNSKNKSLIKSIICAGFYPNIAIVEKISGSNIKAYTVEKETVYLHPSSINHYAHNFPTPYLTYFLKRKSSKIYLFDTTCVSPIALIFAAPSMFIVKGQEGDLITIPNDITFICNEGAHLIEILHKKLDDILEFKINNPDVIAWGTYEGNILTAMIELLSDSDKDFELPEHRILPRYK